MCRHLGYVGAPCAPSGPLFHTPNSLLRQSFAPRDMRGGGSVNADGFGLAWYQGEDPPLRYRSASPLWTDQSLPGLSESLRAKAYLAAVRNGTTGMPVTEAAAAPFTAGRWAFSHNGVIRGWPDSVVPLAEKLPTARLLTLPAPTDSVLLWAVLAERLLAGAEPVGAVTGLVAEVEAFAPGSRLNLLLTDGERLIGTAWTHSLSYRHTGSGTIVASEPVDDQPGWLAVPDRHAVVADGAQTEIVPIHPFEETAEDERDRSRRA